MISIYLCEDDKNQLDYLKKVIENGYLIYELDMQVAAACSSPKELLDIVDRQHPHMSAYFLDIDLKNEMDGIALAVEIRKRDPRGFIIFITTHDEFMALTFQYKVETLDFISKDTEDLRERIRDVLLNIVQKYQAPPDAMADTLQITVGKKISNIRQQDIYFIESIINSHKIAIHLADETIECFSTLKAISDELGDDFIQCHKAYIVNYKRIKILDRKNYRITFHNDQSCDCSTRMFQKLYDKVLG